MIRLVTWKYIFRETKLEVSDEQFLEATELLSSDI